MRWNQRKWDCDSCITTLYLVTRLQSVLPKRRLEYYSLVAPSNGLSSYSLPLLFPDGTHEEARYQIPDPYHWKGKLRKDFHLRKGLRYLGKS